MTTIEDLQKFMEEARKHGVYLHLYLSQELMGWPDFWTKYGIDEKGNMVELSDNARYNLIGNGVVPQVVKEIVRYHIGSEKIDKKN